MAGRKASHVLVALTLLVSAHGYPMPLSKGMMGMLGGMGLQGGHLMGMNPMNPLLGQSYGCGSFGNCNGMQNPTMFATEPDKLAAVTRRVDAGSGRVDGILAVISSQQDNMMPMQNQGHHGFGNLKMGFGMPPMYGMGAFSPFSKGMMGAMGGFGKYAGGMPGMFGMHPESLQLDLTVNVGTLPNPLEVLLVFTSAVDTDTCAPDALGGVLTGSADHQNGFVTGGHMMMMPPVSPASPGADMSSFGVISTVTVNSGSNSFQIRGLGSFNRLSQLAGRGIALCEDVTIGMNGPMCTGDTFQVLFCGQLGYSINTPQFTL